MSVTADTIDTLTKQAKAVRGASTDVYTLEVVGVALRVLALLREIEADVESEPGRRLLVLLGSVATTSAIAARDAALLPKVSS